MSFPVLFNLLCLMVYAKVFTGTRMKRQTDLSYGSPAYKYCECGRRNVFTDDNVRIIGGGEVSENEFPWMAVIVGNGSQLVCGATIINDRYVLTAAHCLVLGYRTEEMKVVVGAHDMCRAARYSVTFSIEHLIPHPKYEAGAYYVDVMLVKLVMRITFNRFVRPICLPKFGWNIATRYAGHVVSVLGWGFADANGTACALRSANLTLYSPANCPSKVSTLICAGYMQAERGPCRGDSGGPLQIINEYGKFQLIGIVSSGIGCADPTYTDFFTDVAQLIPWIMKITAQDSMYCWR